MSGRPALSLFVGSLRDRLTDPSVVGLQLIGILAPLCVVRQFSLVSEENSVLALVVVPVLVFLSLYLPVGIVQDVTLRLEEQSDSGDAVYPCWQSIATQFIVWINAAIVIPMLIWGLPISGVLGYTAEAATGLVLGEQVVANYSLTGTVLIGLVLVGGAWTALGVLVSLKMFVGPNFAHDRLRMYLGLRSSLRSNGSRTLVPLDDGCQAHIDTAILADACVLYSLTRAAQDGLPKGIDIGRVVEQTTPQPASRWTLSVFLITLNRRFLSVLLGSMVFVIAILFGLELDTLSPVTVLSAAVLGPVTQLPYQHPFVSARLGALHPPE